MFLSSITREGYAFAKYDVGKATGADSFPETLVETGYFLLILHFIPYWRMSPPLPILGPVIAAAPTRHFESLQEHIWSLPCTQRRLHDGLEQVAWEFQVWRIVASNGGLLEGSQCNSRMAGSY